MTTPSQNPSGTQAQGGTQRSGNDGGGLKDSAAQLAEQAKNEGKRQVDTTRQTAAESVEKLARSARAAASELQQDDVGHLSQYIANMADGLHQFASRLREKSGEEIAQEVARLAREKPALFVTGSVALGFGLARFARAKPPGARASSESSTSSWAGSDSDLSGTAGYAGADLGSSGMDATGATGSAASGAYAGASSGGSHAGPGLDSTASSRGSDRSASGTNLGAASGLNDESGYGAGSTGSAGLAGGSGANSAGSTSTVGSGGIGLDNASSGSDLASGAGAQTGLGASGSDDENRSSTGNRGGLNS